MTGNRRSLLVRIRDTLSALDEQFATPAPEPEPEPPRIEHLYGSTYCVRMSFEEVLAARGYTATAALYRRRLMPPGDAQQIRETAAAITGQVMDALWSD